MEKIKKIFTPHTSDPNDPNTDPTSTGMSGQGSHFNGETRSGMAGVVGRDAPSHMPGEYPSEAPQSGYTTGTSQGVNYNNQGGPSSQNPTNTPHTGYGVSGATINTGSHGAGLTGTSASTTSGPRSSSLANKADPRVDSDNSRLTGHGGTTGYGTGSTGTSTTTTSGPHSSNLANKADPRVDSDNSRATGQDATSGYGHGISGVHNSTSTGAALGTAAIGHSSTDRSYNLGSGTTSTTAGPHSSNLANRADPRVDSDLDSSRASENSGGSAAIIGTTTARSFPLAGTSHSTTSGPHSSNLANKADPRVDSDNSRLGGTGLTGSTSGTGYGNRGSSNTYGSTTHGTEHNLGRDAASSGTGAILGSTASRGPSAVSGPHQTVTANLLDPNTRGGSSAREDAIEHAHSGTRVGGGAEEADKQHKNVGETSADAVRIGDTDDSHFNTQGSSGLTGSSHTARNTAIGGGVGAGAAGLVSHEHDKHHNDRGAGFGTTSTTTGTTTTTITTTGHHSATPATSTTGQHHGRDAAVGAGAGAAAVGLAHRGKGDSVAEGSFDQHGNRIGNASNIEQSGHRPTTDIGSGATTHNTTQGAPREKESLMHKLTKKLSPGHKSSDDADTHGSTTDSSHTGRNAALAGGAGAGVGAAAYGADKHHHGSTSASPTTHGTAYGSSDTTYPTNTSTARAVDPSTSGSGHNYGRDAALAGGAAGVGGAAYAAGSHHDGTSSNVDPTTYGSHSGTSTTNPYGTTTSHSTTDPTRSNATTTDHHYGRGAAVAGGAVGAGGAAYEADQHHRQKELEKEMKKQHKHDEKELDKELKKQHKHDEKELDKDLKKQHKHGEKEMAKEQKHAEKEAKKLQEREEKQHEKDSKGGLFGLTKSHKNDKYTDEEHREFDRLERENLVNPSHGREAATGAGAYGSDINKPLPSAPETGHKDIGDHLHGVERNRGVDGSSGFPGTEGFGDHSHSGHGPNVVTDSEGRHRLHKEPPSGHPAAHATHSGTGDLDGNSGVANRGGNTY